MARRDQFTMRLADRQRRRFSDGFKKQKVKEIELIYTKVVEVCRQYQVSDVAVDYFQILFKYVVPDYQ